jgi:hypothetical protein
MPPSTNMQCPVCTLAWGGTRDKYGLNLGKLLVLPKRFGICLDQQVEVDNAVESSANQVSKFLSQEPVEGLGSMPDTKLAALFGVSRFVVAEARELRGIPTYAFSKTLETNAEFIALLGSVSDRALVEQFGGSISTVKKIRDGLGLPPYAPVLSSEIEVCLGKMSDNEVAFKFGKKSYYIRKERQKLEIPAFSLTETLSKDEVFISLLGVIPDTELAFKYVCSISAIKRSRLKHARPMCNHIEKAKENAKWDANRTEAISLLGTVTDAELSRRFGGFSSRYAYQRKILGIAPFLTATQSLKRQMPPSSPVNVQNNNQALEEPKQSRRSIGRPKFELPDDVIPLLGTINDSELSRQTGISKERISRNRSWLGIQACRFQNTVAPGLLESLGKMTDTEVAAMFGCTAVWAKKERLKRGIPCFKAVNIPGLVECLGKISDYAVAVKFGVSAYLVNKERTKRRIPKLKKRHLTRIEQ